MKTGIAAIILAFGMGTCQAQTSQGIIRQPLVVIIGTPFSADKITQTTTPQLNGTLATRTVNGRDYRDSQGRTRQEDSIDSAGVWHFLRISDPVAGWVYAVHVHGKRYTANRSRLPSAQNLVTASRLGAVEYTRPNIGLQTIAGFLAVGHQNVAESSTLESWISPQLATTLMSKTTRSNRIVTTTLSNILLAEPDPQLFQPPQGYTFLDSGN
jgi:hypothetical protein